MLIDTGDIRLFCERGSDEQLPEILFISGSGGDLRNKPNQFDSPLAQAFRLLCYDQRGLGRSDVPDGDYSMADDPGPTRPSGALRHPHSPPYCSPRPARHYAPAHAGRNTTI